jgi:hypothetical protein
MTFRNREERERELEDEIESHCTWLPKTTWSAASRRRKPVMPRAANSGTPH